MQEQLTQEELQEKLQAKIVLLQKFLEENKMNLSATQEISKEKWIQNVVLYHDLENYSKLSAPTTGSSEDTETKKKK